MLVKVPNILQSIVNRPIISPKGTESYKNTIIQSTKQEMQRKIILEDNKEYIPSLR